LGKCRLCGKTSKTISDSLGVCVNCLRENEEALTIALKSHAEWRLKLGFPPTPPRDSKGVKCNLCVNECVIPEGGMGFCGIIVNRDGKLQHRMGVDNALAYTYLDPHPTNCVATPVCPAVTSEGYPNYTKTLDVERGYYNLAVFFAGCNLDCLFCQNWEHKTTLSEIIREGKMRSRSIRIMNVNDVVHEALDNEVTCICYFGGDPGPHITFALRASKKLLEIAKEKDLVKRICWETNGIENTMIMREMAKLSLESGGIVKIDWKAWTPQVYQALTGIDGWKAVARVKENIKTIYGIAKDSDRVEPPLLVVSVLLVPGYVDEEEVYGIASFLSQFDETIPLVLLAFHPDYRMEDLPPTSLRHAEEAVKAAKQAGLKRVFVGNYWLLGPYY